MSQPCECYRGNGGHNHPPSRQNCFRSVRTRQIESLPSSPCYHTYSHTTVPPNYYTTSHDTAPPSPGSFCSCQPPMNHIHSPNVHLQPGYGSPHSHSPAHHCGSYQHLPSVASPLHISRVSASMTGSPMPTNPTVPPCHNNNSSSGFHTPTHHHYVHYNATPPGQPLTPQMTSSGFVRERVPQAQACINEHHQHSRPQSPDVSSPVSDYNNYSCPTTPTSCHSMNSNYQLPKPEMMVEFSPVSDALVKPRTTCFEMGVDVSGGGRGANSGVIPTPFLRERSSSFINTPSLSDDSDMQHVNIQQQESTPSYQLQIHSTGTNTVTTSTHTGGSGSRAKKASNANSAVSYPTLKKTRKSPSPCVTPFSVRVKRIKVEGKEARLVEDKKKDSDEPLAEAFSPTTNLWVPSSDRACSSSSRVIEEHDVIEVEDDNGRIDDTKTQNVDVCTQPTELPPSIATPQPQATARTDAQDSQQSTAQKDHPEDFTLMTKCLSQGSSNDDTFSNQPKKSVVLHQWYFNLLPTGSVILYGLKDQDTPNSKYWRSGPVSERVSSNLLLTRSGTVYHLMGTVNTNEMRKAPLWSTVTGKKVLKKFNKGFPFNWESLLQEMNALNSVNSDAEHTPEEKPSVIEQSTPSVSLNSIKSGPNTIDSSFLTSLKRSSSGRLIKPNPHSVNEHSASPFVYMYDMRGSFTGITSPVIDLTVDEDEGDPEAPLSFATEVKKEPLPKKKMVKKEQLNSIARDSESEASSSFSESSQKSRRKRVRKVVLHNKSKRPCKITQESSKRVAVQREEEQQEDVVDNAISELHSEIGESAKNERLTGTEKHKTRGRKKREQCPPLENETESRMKQLEAESDETIQINRRTRNERVTVLEPLTPKDGKESDHGEGVVNTDVNSKTGGSMRGKTGKGRKKQAARLVNDEMESEKEVEEVAKPKRSTYKRKTKRVEPSCEPMVLRKKPNKAQTERASHRPKRSKPVATEQPKKWSTVSWSDELLEEETIEWTQSDIARLKRIVLNVPALTTNFWEVVAQKLATGHTARECSSQYLQITAKSRNSVAGPSREKKPQAGGLTTITAKEGTIKRKRQLRNALEQLDVGYSDDIFDATPYKKKVKHVQIELSDDECFNGSDDDSDCGTSYTPIEAKRRRVGAPPTYTPKLCDYLTTPDLKSGLKRNTADNVIYKIQNAKKTQKQPVKKQSSNVQRKRSKGGTILSLENLHRIRSGEHARLRLIEDSDESSSEDSDPFSDMDEDYQNIMKQLH